jgi:hypothetical protein
MVEKNWLIFVLILVVTITGCTVRARIYDGPSLPISKVAVLKGPKQIKLRKVNGKCVVGRHVPADYCEPLNKGEDNPFVIELLPENHLISYSFLSVQAIGGRTIRRTYSTKDLSISHKFEAGITYILDNWGAKIVEEGKTE